ncbi:hypothetical protein Tco_1458973 [Tanacetum coccineum]
MLTSSWKQMDAWKDGEEQRNEGISSNNSLLSGGSSTVPQCLLEEYEDYLQRSHEDFQPLPKFFTKTIFTPEEPSRPTKPQSEWINLMHGDKSPKTLTFQQQKKQLKPCEIYKQSYNANPPNMLWTINQRQPLVRPKRRCSNSKQRSQENRHRTGSPGTKIGTQ